MGSMELELVFVGDLLEPEVEGGEHRGGEHRDEAGPRRPLRPQRQLDDRMAGLDEDRPPDELGHDTPR